jgi:hypothetical protein
LAHFALFTALNYAGQPGQPDENPSSQYSSLGSLSLARSLARWVRLIVHNLPRLCVHHRGTRVHRHSPGGRGRGHHGVPTSAGSISRPACHQWHPELAVKNSRFQKKRFLSYFFPCFRFFRDRAVLGGRYDIMGWTREGQLPPDGPHLASRRTLLFACTVLSRQSVQINKCMLAAQVTTASRRIQRCLIRVSAGSQQSRRHRGGARRTGPYSCNLPL